MSYEFMTPEQYEKKYEETTIIKNGVKDIMERIFNNLKQNKLSTDLDGRIQAALFGINSEYRANILKEVESELYKWGWLCSVTDGMYFKIIIAKGKHEPYCKSCNGPHDPRTKHVAYPV